MFEFIIPGDDLRSIVLGAIPLIVGRTVRRDGWGGFASMARSASIIPATVWATIPADRARTILMIVGQHRCGKVGRSKPACGTINRTVLGDDSVIVLSSIQHADATIFRDRGGDGAARQSRRSFNTARLAYDRPQGGRDDLGHRSRLTVDARILQPVW